MMKPGVHEGERRWAGCPECGSHRVIALVDFDGVMVWQCECGSTEAPASTEELG